MTQASGAPAEILIVGETALTLYRRLLVDADGVLQVNLSDNALRDLGIVDVGEAIPGSTTGATSQATVDNSGADLIVAARSGRAGVTLTLTTDDREVYYGFSSGITTADGALLGFTKGMSVRLATQAAVYGITTSSSCVISVAEDYDA